MGDWTYYASMMRIGDVVDRVGLADEVHRSSALSELIQREVGARTVDITRYFLEAPQRFSNALVVGVYGGDPDWHEVRVHLPVSAYEGHERPPSDDVHGYLALSGREKLFALDGQHRVVGLRDAIKQRPDLADEEISALFVGHRRTKSGVQRTRRLFTTLNRYAKPVTKGEAIALDEDDLVAVITRELVADHPVLKGRVSSSMTKNIPSSDRESVTSLVAVYDGLNRFLRSLGKKKWREYLRTRPPETDVVDALRSSRALFTALGRRFSPLRPRQSATPKKLRGDRGGDLVVRPIGLVAIIEAVRSLVDSDVPLASAVQRVSRVPSKLAEHPWRGVLWDAENKQMITRGTGPALASALLLHGAGGDCSMLGSSEPELRSQLAGVLNISRRSVRLMRYV